MLLLLVLNAAPMGIINAGYAEFLQRATFTYLEPPAVVFVSLMKRLTRLGTFANFAKVSCRSALNVNAKLVR